MSDDGEEFDVWITRWALTQGVFKKRVELSDADSHFVKWMSGKSLQYARKPHWHRTRREASERVVQMMERKRASLLKQLEQLDNLNVEIPE